MDLKYLYTFRTIVDEGGFNKAAQKLNYTQSTITFQMNQLEQELSTCLFEKNRAENGAYKGWRELNPLRRRDFTVH